MSVLSLVPEDKRKELRKESLESVYSSNSRLNLLNKRKRLNPLVDMSSHSVRSKSGDRYVTQRVLSAKTHRVKQLQNQLADAHYHLQELSNENRVLRAMQKKQDIALQRYENSNAELPQVLNSHSEEMRIQQSKQKQLKQQLRETTQKLKERDMQLQMLRDEHHHLAELSKDRNLPEREKLQGQVSELSLRVQSQGETITMLQRRLALEAKNHRHQLIQEINKHKDTRADLDLAINNADKLSTIIEMKEKMLSSTACRTLKSPTKSPAVGGGLPRALAKSKSAHDTTSTSGRSSDDRHHTDRSLIAKMCESSRNLSSALSHDEETSSSTEPTAPAPQPRSRYTRTRAPARRPPGGTDDIIHLAKTVQEGMADLAIYDTSITNSSPDEINIKLDAMKADLMHKIKNNEEPRKTSALRRRSTEESIEEQINDEGERPKSRGRNSSVSFYEETYKSDEITKREGSATERKHSAKPIDKYCKDIIQDIEKSSKVIDRHVKQFQTSRFENDQIVSQLEAVDKINEIVNGNTEIPSEKLTELNNNFKMLTEQVFSEPPVAMKRSVSGRRGSREMRASVLGDVGMSNQDLLDDLLGKK